jgi:hypothetical protein
MNEQKRAIIEAQVAAEPIPASTKLELVRPDPLRIERWAHAGHSITGASAPAYFASDSDVIRIAARPLSRKRLALFIEDIGSDFEVEKARGTGGLGLISI